ncbi:MAG: AI-2E family transporter YdiK [Myxococcota bacterium]
MTNINPPARDLTRTMLSVLFIGGLIAANIWILKPFLPSLLWAVAIVVATWPVMLRMQALLGGRRSAAVAFMTVALLLLIVVPVFLAVLTIMDNADRIIGWAKTLETNGLPPPPEWVSRIPLAGPRLSSAWEGVSAAGREGLTTRISPYAGKFIEWFFNKAGGAGMMLIEFLLTVVVAAILYSGGETAGRWLLRFARRLAGVHGDNVVILAAKSIRGVALGVVVTALAQSILGGIGLAVTGVPGATVLAAIMFLLCIAQIGAGPVLIPAIIWLYWSGHVLGGTVLIVFTVVAVTMDNLLRPFLIKKGVDLPLLLILAGVLGGLMAFGIIGLFIGPVVLAVTYTLIGAWISAGEQKPVEAVQEKEGGTPQE